MVINYIPLEPPNTVYIYIYVYLWIYLKVFRLSHDVIGSIPEYSTAIGYNISVM